MRQSVIHGPLAAHVPKVLSRWPVALHSPLTAQGLNWVKSGTFPLVRIKACGLCARPPGLLPVTARELCPLRALTSAKGGQLSRTILQQRQNWLSCERSSRLESRKRELPSAAARPAAPPHCAATLRRGARPRTLQFSLPLCTQK